MNSATFMDNVRTMQDGKVEIPTNIQKIMGVSDGSRVTFITDGDYVRIVNPSVFAMRELQKAMEGAAEEAGWKSDDDVVDYIMEMRRKQAEGIY
ncbi:MAG: hypothetical protein IJM47_00740 [Synergistaceae bacterium]|nr:hypothetical protein [Synergistaceae bacterium]